MKTETVEKPELLTARQLGKMLSLSKTKIYSMIATGALFPSLRIGRARRWRRRDAELFIEWGLPNREKFIELKSQMEQS